MQSYTTFQNFALLVLRLIIAAVFIVAGYCETTFWSGSHPEHDLDDAIHYEDPYYCGAPWWVRSYSRPPDKMGRIWPDHYHDRRNLLLQFVFHIQFVMPTGAGWNFPPLTMLERMFNSTRFWSRRLGQLMPQNGRG